MKKKKRILLAPLDWGLGHATRCIPIAHALEKNGCKVIFAADERPLQLLMNEFPNNDFIKLSGYKIRYPKNGNMASSMLLQSYKILKKIKEERRALQHIIKDFKIDGVISDNRFGLYSKNIPCVFITHQLKIQSPYFQKWIQKINFKYINRFNECWVPDIEGNILTGNLTNNINTPFQCKFIGPLSRFKRLKQTDDLDILAIVSGPEPQRSLFETLLRKQLKGRNAVLILGKPELEINEKEGDLNIISHLNSQDLNQAMTNAKIVISRSGYSTIMDLAALEKKAVFIPTPGQTEQLYLADYFCKKKTAYTMSQEDFNLDIALNQSLEFSGFKKTNHKQNWPTIFTLFEG